MVDIPTSKTVMPAKKAKRRWIDREQFHVARLRAGLDVVAAADMLDVTERTIECDWLKARMVLSQWLADDERVV